jgi:hypothetical protein
VIIDAHTHIFPPRFRQRREELLRRDATFGDLYASPRAVLASAEDLVAAMDAAGVDVAVAVGIGWTDQELAREANDYLLEAVARYPRRLVGFCAANPAWGDGALEEVERCVRAGLKGVGELHPDSQGFGLGESQTIAPLMDLARRLGVPVLVHASEPVGHQYRGKGHVTPPLVMRLVEAFPQATIICAHWGGGLPFYALMPEVAGALKNVYFDSAASPLLYNQRIFPIMAELVGPEKLLFATDFPLVQPQRLLAQVRNSGLPPDVQAMLLGGNAARLLGLGQQGSPCTHADAPRAPQGQGR